MNSFHDDLHESIKAGFLDRNISCKDEYLPQLVVNDKVLGKKVLPTIIKELRECNEFWLGVAFLTKSGLATIINTLKELEEKNIKGKILVSQYQNFTEPEALKTLIRFTNIELKMAVRVDFHAKGYLFRKNNGYSIIVGSSNLTASALCVNREWNLKVTASDNSAIIHNSLQEFTNDFNNAERVDNEFIRSYEDVYKANKEFIRQNELILSSGINISIQPNAMQIEALANLKEFRIQNKGKALLISATATGKTYLSAFDVKATGARRCLFLVHRSSIAEAALRSFQRIFTNGKTFGMYSGERKELEADFLFSTVQTISKDNHLLQFDKEHFDYIIIDETHRAGADSYQKIIDYFQPRFLLGMTATPERTDGFNIFKQFNYDIAYEIRLQRALEEDMLCSFHYYGVTDIFVDEKKLEEEAGFNLLVSEERVNKIIEKATFYGCDNGSVRGLVFCSTVRESKTMSDAFNSRGYKTVSLSGENSAEERSLAILRLESDSNEEKLDYIFTVDIFNEGIDIPKVNQVILLRPTKSAIIFVQQLGRGLRKAENKSYLTVIDFIGNYYNNYLVPIALFGDTSYNKDRLRKLMSNGSSLIPGASTVNFDKISRERIFKSIDNANLSLRKDLVKDYQLLKYKIGKVPTMIDFVEHGARDPYMYVSNYDSYFNFLTQVEDGLKNTLTNYEIKLIELFSKHIANGKRIEEVIVLQEVLAHNYINIDVLKEKLLKKYGFIVSDDTISSCIRNINFECVNKPEEIVFVKGNAIQIHTQFSVLLKNNTFSVFLIDLLGYAQRVYDNNFDKEKSIGGFVLYQKYSRKDVCRILNWERDEHSTMYGYKIKHGTCPVFVNYHKSESITSTTQYEDKFISQNEFQWMSRSRRTLHSSEIVRIRNYKKGLRLSLFVKKSNDEDKDFYYMGEITPTKFSESTMLDENGGAVSVVVVNFSMNQPVESSIYEYIVNPE